MQTVDIVLDKGQAQLVKLILENYQSFDVRELSRIFEVVSIIDYEINRLWDENKNQDAECVCGHVYHRHFDSYEDMYPIGCKYCECETFEQRV
jgi:hypothetical protein